MSGLLLGTVLSFRTCWLHNMMTLPSWLLSNDVVTWSYQGSLSSFTPTSLYIIITIIMLTLLYDIDILIGWIRYILSDTFRDLFFVQIPEM